jgi:hypothetical protein
VLLLPGWFLLLLPGMVGHRAAPTGMVLAAAAAGYGWNPCCSYWSGCSCYCRVWLATLLPRHDFNVTGFPRRDFNVTGCSRHDFNVLLLLPGMVGHRAAPTGMFLAAAAAGYGWTPCCSYWSGCSCYCRVWLATLLPRHDFNVTGFPRRDFNVTGCSRHDFNVLLLLLPGMVGHRAAATGMFLAAAAAGYGWTPCCSYWSGCSCYCRVRLATLLPRQDFNVTGFWRHDFNVRVDSRVTFRVTIPDGSKNQNAIVWACDFPFELVKIWRDAREQYFTNRDVKYYIFFVARDLRIPWCPLRCSVLGELCLRSSLLS